VGVNLCIQATDKTTFIITPAAYQSHFYISGGAAFQVVGLTLYGSRGTNGGGITVNGASCQLGTQDVIFSNIIAGPAVNVYSSSNVHIR